MTSACAFSTRGRRAAVTLLLAGTCLLRVASVHAAVPAGYTLAWSDEFDGTTLDTSKWGYRQLGVRHDAINTTNAVTVGGGALKITTYTENGQHYTGMISTDNKYMPLYGYMEARIQFSSSPGQWSAFWLQSPTVNIVGDPHANGTEMDVVEHRASDKNGNNISNQIVSNIHWDGYVVGTRKSLIGELRGSGLATGYHTYAVLWTPDVQIYYIDGAYAWSIPNSTALDPVPPEAPCSHRTEYIILSSEVRNQYGWAGVIPTGGYGTLATSTTNMLVDYVRVYQLQAPASPTGLAAIGAGSGQVSLNWTASPYASHYNVKRAATSGGPYTTIASNVTGTSYLNTGLTNGTTYYYVVSAANYVGESANTAQVSATPPGPPQNLAPTDDAFVRDGTYAATNYGTATTLTVKADATGYRRNAHLKFDLTPAATVGTATLKLYATTANNDPTRTISIYSATNVFTEGTITWNNAPGNLNFVTSFTVSDADGVWYNVDLTNYIKGKKTGGQNIVSLILTNTGANSAGSDVSFASKESATNDPLLTITP